MRTTLECYPLSSTCILWHLCTPPKRNECEKKLTPLKAIFEKKLPQYCPFVMYKSMTTIYTAFDIICNLEIARSPVSASGYCNMTSLSTDMFWDICSSPRPAAALGPGCTADLRSHNVPPIWMLHSECTLFYMNRARSLCRFCCPGAFWGSSPGP